MPVDDTTLNQNGVVLRLWHPDDAEWYVHARDEQVFRWTTERRELTVQETAHAIQQINDDANVFAFAIAHNQSNELLGSIAIVRDQTKPQSAEVMYWLAPQGRGRGVATQALQIIVAWAFNTLNVDQILLQTHVDNIPSQRVAERVGFRQMEHQNDNSEGGEKVWFVLTHAM
ncbi:MAG: GNAT family protein [Chloroflexota bacterium]